MSVHNDSLEMKSSERKQEAPELEYKQAQHDSLSMFFAAVGGAVLGMLATLLVLALINGGTLNFTNPERIAVVEANLSRVNENVGAVSQNIDAVSQQVDTVRSDISTAQAQMDQAMAALEEQGANVNDMQTAMQSLEQAGQKFDLFVLGLRQALDSVEPAVAAPVVASASTTTDGVPAPIVELSSAVQPGNVAVLFFVDANGNGVLDGDETSVVGIGVAVTGSDGTAIGNYTSGDAGILIEGLFGWRLHGFGREQ